MDLDAVLWERKTFFVDHEFKRIFTLITLKLDDLAGFFVGNDGAVAGEGLLHEFEDFLEFVSVWNTLDGSQSLTTIALLNTNVNVLGILLARGFLLAFACVVGVRERVEGFEVLDLGGHKLVCLSAKVSK